LSCTLLLLLLLLGRPLLPLWCMGTVLVVWLVGTSTLPLLLLLRLLPVCSTGATPAGGRLLLVAVVGAGLLRLSRPCLLPALVLLCLPELLLLCMGCELHVGQLLLQQLCGLRCECILLLLLLLLWPLAHASAADLHTPGRRVRCRLLWLRLLLLLLL
jgi:hypothetical protein